MIKRCEIVVVVYYICVSCNSRTCLVTEKELKKIAKRQQEKEQLLEKERQEREQAKKRRMEGQLKAMKMMKEQIEGTCYLCYVLFISKAI